MKLSDVLKAALLSRLVGLDPLDACGLAERAAVLPAKPGQERSLREELLVRAPAASTGDLRHRSADLEIPGAADG
jgi:hypothetical protein